MRAKLHSGGINDCNGVVIVGIGAIKATINCDSLICHQAHALHDAW